MDASVFLVGEKVASLFLVLIAGVIARKAKIIDSSSTKGLSALLLNLTQPLMIVTSFQMDFDAQKLKNGFLLLGLSVAIHIFLAAASFWLYKPIKDPEQKKIYEMGTIFCNCSFLGYPVLRVIFGEELGVFYGAFYAMFFNIFMWTYGVYLISRKDKGAKNSAPYGAGYKFPLKKIFFNAGMISSVLGIVIFFSGIKLPDILYNSAKSVGDMTFPLSMIIIGSLISEIRPRDMFLSAKNYYYISVKLLLVPGFVALLCHALKLPPLLVYMGAVMTSMPSAANVAMFAEAYGASSKSAAINIGLSTLFSIVTIPLSVYFLERLLKL